MRHIFYEFDPTVNHAWFTNICGTAASVDSGVGLATDIRNNLGFETT